MANVEANIIRKEDVEPIIQEKNIRKLVKGSRANRFDQKIFKVLYELKIKKGIEILMRVKIPNCNQDGKGSPWHIPKDAVPPVGYKQRKK